MVIGLTNGDTFGELYLIFLEFANEPRPSEINVLNLFPLATGKGPSIYSCQKERMKKSGLTVRSLNSTLK